MAAQFPHHDGRRITRRRTVRGSYTRFHRRVSAEFSSSRRSSCRIPTGPVEPAWSDGNRPHKYCSLTPSRNSLREVPAISFAAKIHSKILFDNLDARQLFLAGRQGGEPLLNVNWRQRSRKATVDAASTVLLVMHG